MPSPSTSLVSMKNELQGITQRAQVSRYRLLAALLDGGVLQLNWENRHDTGPVRQAGHPKGRGG